MPLQNRVNPFGDFEATAARGTLVGNRGGPLHDEQQRLTGGRPYKTKSWLACTLVFKDRRRAVMAPDLYTELFFLDEATALAAGHRPCRECRRNDYLRFAAAWNKARDLPAGRRVLVKEIDDALHADRWDGAGQRRRRARLAALPDGAMVALPAAPATAWLVWEGHLRRWSHGGYDAVRAMDPSTIVDVLTPDATVAALASGYRPMVHASLGAADPEVRVPAPA